MNKLISIILDVLCGIFLVVTVFILKPTYFSSKISLLITLGSIIPGLFLSGVSRNIVVNNFVKKRILYKSLIYSIAFNSIFLLIFYYLNDKGDPNISVFLAIILAISFSSSSQVLSRAWFYIYGYTKYFFIIKLVTTFFRLFFVFFAFVFHNISLILISNILISLVELSAGLYFFNTKNFKLRNFKDFKKEQKENLAVGATVGISRISTSTLKVLIENYIGSILSHLLIFEQISTGLVSIYEKYYVRVFRETKKIYIAKFLFSAFILFFLIEHVFFNKSSVIPIPLILLISMTSALPASSNYELIKIKGVMAYSKNSLINSIFIFILIGLNYFFIKISFLYIIIYFACFTFPLLINYHTKFYKKT